MSQNSFPGSLGSKRKRELFLVILIVIMIPGYAVAAGQTLARILDGQFDIYTIKSTGGQILLADLDANVYQVQGRGEEHADHETLVSSSDEEGGGCEGGPGGFCMQVLDGYGDLICWADRPERPGWMRDPLMACFLPDSARPETYTLRIFLRSGETSCGDQDPLPPHADTRESAERLYVLKLQLQGQDEEGAIPYLQDTGHAPF